jgi:hypothetical protein
VSLKHETLPNLIKKNTTTWQGKGRNSKRGASNIQKCKCTNEVAKKSNGDHPKGGKIITYVINLHLLHEEG